MFEVVSQLNRGSELVESQEEREWIAELNLMAGQRATYVERLMPAFLPAWPILLGTSLVLLRFDRLRGVVVNTFGPYQNAWEWWIPRELQRGGQAAGAADSTQ